MGAAVLWQYAADGPAEPFTRRPLPARNLFISILLRCWARLVPESAEGTPSALPCAQAADGLTESRTDRVDRSTRRATARTVPRIEVLPIRNPKVIFKALATGAVLYSTEDEVYFGLNSVGVRVWELLPPAHQTIDELCRVLASEYPEAGADVIRADVAELIDELLKLGLVQAAPSAAQRVS